MTEKAVGYTLTAVFMTTQVLRATTSLPLNASNTSLEGALFEDSRTLIDKIIIHTVTVPTLDDGGTPSSKMHGSWHYFITSDGKIEAFIPEDKTAYHSNNLFVDQSSIGILHEDGGDPKGERTEELYHASSLLVYDLCKFYGIEISRSRVMKHSDVTLRGSSCPDGLDVERIVEGAKALDTGSETVNTVVGKLEEGEAKRNWKLYEEASEKLKVKDERIEELEKEVEQLAAENTGIKKQIKSAFESNSRLADEISEKNKEDSTALDNGLKAEEERNGLRDELTAIATALGTKPVMRDMLVKIDDLLNQQKKLAKETTSFFQSLFNR